MIILYTKPSCPQCMIAKQLLDKNKIEYNVEEDIDISIKIAEENNIMSFPFANIDGVVINNRELIKYINKKGE